MTAESHGRSICRNSCLGSTVAVQFHSAGCVVLFLPVFLSSPRVHKVPYPDSLAGETGIATSCSQQFSNTNVLLGAHYLKVSHFVTHAVYLICK